MIFCQKKTQISSSYENGFWSINAFSGGDKYITFFKILITAQKKNDYEKL